MENVFLLHHSYESEGREETKFIGVYSSNAEAEAAIKRLKDKNGFRYRPDCFFIAEQELNKDHWQDGFATMTTIHVKDKNGNWITTSAECLPDDIYQVVELYNNEMLGEFKHEDFVRCEERNNMLYAVELVKRN
jgi:hypothetical protein